MAKVIKAVFGAGERAKTCPQWQYDYNTVLQFIGLDLPEEYEVDLSNSSTGQSVTVLGDVDGCTIPAQMFIPGTSIFAWVYIVDETSGYTRAQVEIPISPRAVHTGAEPTPEQRNALDEAIALLNAATEAIPDTIEAALAEAKASGEFDGPQGPEGPQGPQGESGTPGNSIWRGGAVRASGTTPYYFLSDLSGRTDVSPSAGDLIVSNIFWLWQIKRIVGQTVYLTSLGSIKGETGADGEDGYSPTVTITEITGGHRVTITDEVHPQGQSFDVMDGTGGGGGSSDYNDLSNKPQIAGVTLSGNKSLADLGIAAVSDIPTVPSAYASTPADFGTASAGSSTSWARGDHVHKMPSASDVGAYALPSGGIPKTDLASAVQTSLGKADTALQSAPVTSVNGQTGAVTVPEPFVVTYSTSDMTTWTCDKTFAQITAAMAAGKQIVMIGSVGGTPIAQGCDVLLADDGSYYTEFWIRYSFREWYRIVHHEDDTIDFYNDVMDYDTLEAVAANQGSGNAGKFLVVGSDGVVVPTAVPSAQGVGF